MKKLVLMFSAAALCVLAGSNFVNAQKITVTVAGNGSAGYSGDSGPGRNASLNGLKDVCMDAAQNIYFSDQANGVIRKVSAARGVITTIAGGGVSLADGIPATNAFLTPNYLCVDAAGNMYFTNQNEIKKINTAGIVTTIAGSIIAGFGGDGGPAAAALLNNPEGICIDPSGNLFVADRWNHRVREISGGIINTIVGTGLNGYTGDAGLAATATLYSPICVCLDAAGNLFVADQEPDYPVVLDYGVIREINVSSGVITTIAGNGSYTSTYDVPALDALLGTITGMCIDHSTGDLYCNEMSCSCRHLDFMSDTLYLAGGNFGIQGYADNISSPAANMSYPMGMCMDNSGNALIADSANNRIRKIIQLTPTPAFAFGKGQTIETLTGIPFEIDTQMAIADIDAGQTETWTVLHGPVHGTLAGFPATTTSVGTSYLNYPATVAYTSFSTYVGTDSFQVQVSDGALTDIVNIYVNVTDGGTGTGTTAVVRTAAKTPAVNIFPNPASSQLNIACTNWQPGNANVVIMDVADRVFSTSTLTVNSNRTGTAQVDISSLAAGVYIVTVNGSEVGKFVKQ